MNEIYWITRLDYFHTLFCIFMIIGLILTFVYSIFYYVCNGQYIYDDCRGYDTSAKEYKKYTITCLKGLRYSVPIAAIFISLYTFVPTTKEALAIYGVGGTIDYLKDNPTAKKLPNKCIIALDKWVDSLSKTKKEEIESEKEE